MKFIFILLAVINCYGNDILFVKLINKNNNYKNKQDSIFILQKKTGRFFQPDSFPFNISLKKNEEIIIFKSNKYYNNYTILSDTTIDISKKKSKNQKNKEIDYEKFSLTKNNNFNFLNSSYSNIFLNKSEIYNRSNKYSTNSSPNNTTMLFFNNIPIFASLYTSSPFDMISTYQDDIEITNFINSTPDKIHNLCSSTNIMYKPKKRRKTILNLNTEALLYTTGPFTNNLNYALLYRNSVIDKINNNQYPDNRFPTYSNFFVNLSYINKKSTINLWAMDYKNHFNMNKQTEDSLLYSNNDISTENIHNRIFAIQTKYNFNSMSNIFLDWSIQKYLLSNMENIFLTEKNNHSDITFNYSNIGYKFNSDNFYVVSGFSPTLYTYHKSKNISDFRDSTQTKKDSANIKNKLFANGYINSIYKFNKLNLGIGFSINYNNNSLISKFSINPYLKIEYKFIPQLHFDITYSQNSISQITDPLLGDKQNKSISLNIKSHINSIGKSMLSVFMHQYSNANNETISTNTQNQKNFIRGININLITSKFDENFYNNVSYTFSKSFIINSDTSVIYSPNDRTNSLNIQSRYTVLKSKKLLISIKNIFSFATGTPYNTFFVDTKREVNNQYFYINNYNNYARFPFFMNDDISIETIFIGNKISTKIYFAVNNVFNRHNITNYILNPQNGYLSKTYSFPKTSIPYIGVELEF